MNWKQLLGARRVARQRPDQAEIEALRVLAVRSRADAQVDGVSEDGRFGHAYTGARALATIVIRASGYRVLGSAGGHYYTFVALAAADQVRFGGFAAYFNLCREKRNELSYLNAGIVSGTELAEILREVRRFEAVVGQWLRERRPDLA